MPAPAERVITMIMSPEVTGTQELTLLTSIIPPGSSTGLHKHNGDEFMYVVTGRGEFVEKGRGQDFEPDCMLFGRANEEHQVRNTGKDMLKLVCVYSPPLKPAGLLAEAVDLAKKHLTSMKKSTFST